MASDVDDETGDIHGGVASLWNNGFAQQVACNYCGGKARFHANSARLYRGRDRGPFWVCAPCNAWIAADPQTLAPLCSLANREHREAREAAQRAFDALWQTKMEKDGSSKLRAQGAARRWLAGKMRVPAIDLHIRVMTIEACRKALAICKPYVRTQLAADRADAHPQDKD